MINSSMLDISSLVKTTDLLDEAILAYQTKSADKLIRDATIQRFKCTYERCNKLLRRYLVLTELNAQVIDEMSFPNLIQMASERGLLLKAWDIWRLYRDARNITSYTYDEDKAIMLMKVVASFLMDANYLLQQLKHRIKIA